MSDEEDKPDIAAGAKARLRAARIELHKQGLSKEETDHRIDAMLRPLEKDGPHVRLWVRAGGQEFVCKSNELGKYLPDNVHADFIVSLVELAEYDAKEKELRLAYDALGVRAAEDHERQRANHEQYERQRRKITQLSCEVTRLAHHFTNELMSQGYSPEKAQEIVEAARKGSGT